MTDTFVPRPNSGFATRAVRDPVTGQWRWVPVNSADTSADMRDQGMPVVPSVPFLSQAVDGIYNTAGALTTGAINALPSLGAMMFGRETPQAAPVEVAPAGPSALSFGGAQPAAMTPTSFRMSGAAPSAAPVAGVGDPASMAWNVFLNGLIPQESGGRAGVEGPETKWGRAQGLTQMLPSTAKGVAEKHGIPWQPERMRGTSPEDAAYQRNLGWLYFQEGLQKTGSIPGALMYYHGGPNERQWGPKTQTYAQEVMQRAMNGGSLPGGSRVASATRGPGYVPLNLGQMMGMVPDPRLLSSVALPEAPQLEAPPERPAQQGIDKNQFLGPLAQALEVPERDRSRDAWERVQAMLGSAASAMVGQTDTVDMLLAGGGAAQRGHQSERDRQRELDRADAEARRQAKAMLARAGMDVDLANLATLNTNLDRAWQDKVDQAQTKFANLSAVDQRAVQEIMANVDISRFNVGAQNQTALARAQAGMGVLEANNQMQNRSIEAGWQADQSRQQLVDQTTARLALSGSVGNTAGLLGAVGVPVEPVRGETPDVTNARATAGYVAAGNAPMAVNSFATELVLTGGYKELLDPETEKAVDKLLQQENITAAAMLIGQRLNSGLAGSDGPAILSAIDEFAKRGGFPSAQIISNARQRQAPAN